MIRRLIWSGLLGTVAWGAALLAQSTANDDSREEILGAPAVIGAVVEPENLLTLEAGIRVRRSPHAGAPAIAVVDVRTAVEIVARLEEWLQVRYGSLKGWVRVDRQGRAVQDTVPFRTVPDRRALEGAIRRLHAPPQPGRLGPFDLFTDTTDQKLLEFLALVVTRLPEAFRARYGLDPGEEAQEAIVIFSREADYRAYARELSAAGGYAQGHTSQGLAVVFVEAQTPAEVAAILVHELTHLLNRRVLKTAPHPWLEEGMGNDLAYCAITKRSGRLQLGTLGGQSVIVELPIYLAGGASRVDRQVYLKGPMAALSLLQRRHRSNELLPLAQLMNMGWNEFIDPENLRERYDQSAFLVRYLLGSDDSRLAPGLRAHLSALAVGARAGPVELLGHLRCDLADVERGFARWLDQKSVQ
jgi:hypothetical protein